jgi:hypothetical protein
VHDPGHAVTTMKTYVLALAGALLLFACKKEASPPASTASETAALAPAVPDEAIYAASNALRVIDARAARVVGAVPLQRAVFAIDSSLDGRTIYAASSDGVYEIDADTNAYRLITSVSASDVRVSESGKTLSVLQHEVIVHKNGTRDIEPFHLVVLDLASRRVLSDEEVGPRVFFAKPAEDKRLGLVVDAEGKLRLFTGGKGEGRTIDVQSLLGPDRSGWRLRNAVAVGGAHAFVGVEGRPSAIIDVDLDRGTASAIGLGRLVTIRGLAVSADARTLYVNGARELILVDLETRAVQKAIELPGAHTGLSLSSNGRWAALAQTVDGNGGAVTLVALDALTVHTRIHLDDISPWAIAIRRR